QNWPHPPMPPAP
uniref:Bradykinin-potentiating peptide 12d n=2 Tax=Bothrops TaxID=8721 RepID=BPPCD_BOTCO|nr:RecName: Full=Bradykinin-potentiating peptide 12d; Short=BPP-12d [Bothrops cotiara]P0DKZ7.1 RecName: Full=Bradykinin-potentiating peptide 12d; Short=BPP-12d [Bothrops fonsecai]